MLNLDEPPFPDGMPTFHLERSAPAGIQAYAALRHAIVTLPAPARAARSPSRTSRGSCGASRTPVREAVIRLAESGLFEVLPQRGTFVRKISLKAVEDARFVREAIEIAVLREAVARLRPRFFAAPAPDRGPAGGRRPRRPASVPRPRRRLSPLVRGRDRPPARLVGGRAQKTQMDRVRFLAARRRAVRPNHRPARGDPRRDRARRRRGERGGAAHAPCRDPGRPGAAAPAATRTLS